MNEGNGQRFSQRDVLIMASLAALGGVSSAAISLVRAAVHAVVIIPCGLQLLSGIHVLWLVLAVGLLRRPGVATVTALLKGMVEFMSGNPLGLLVLPYSAVAGIAVDLTWLLLGRRHHPLTYMLAGGLGAMSNLLVLCTVASLPNHAGVVTGIAAMSGASFVSGCLLAGLLGWQLLAALQRAGAGGVSLP